MGTRLLTAVFAVVSIGPAVPAVGADAARGIDVADMDLSVDPADDFYRFANGGWLDGVEIPANDESYSAISQLSGRTTDQLLDLLGGLAATGGLQHGSDEWKAVQVFGQGIDVDTRNALGIEPIRAILDEVDAIGSLEAFHDFQQVAPFRYVTAVFGVFVAPDLVDSSVHSAYLTGPFFGLPNRDYYLEDSESNDAVRAAYLETSAELLTYAGYDPAEADAAAVSVYGLERSLVEPTLTREERQDFSLRHNPMTVAELEATYPLMDWDAYLTSLGLVDIDEVVVTELQYLLALNEIVMATDLETLKDWVKLEVLWSFAAVLSEDIERTAYEFHAEVLGGVTEQDPVERRVLQQVNGILGHAVGRLYVAEHFPPEAKAQVALLVDELIAAFRGRLNANEWMSDGTKAIAVEKLDNLTVKVGYPDQWRSYADVEIEESFAQTFLSATNVEYRRTLALGGQPVDPTEWGLLPQHVNAFYDYLSNDITFPAAILQPPYFDHLADPAVNFGGIGIVIGHEITHGFDLQGSQFDPEGDLASWWSTEDTAAFQALNDEVVALYGGIEVLPGLHVDGQITLTENVADMGGVQVAYDALVAHLLANGEPGPIDSFTQQQRFFIASATIWREEIRPESLETQVRTDVHAPSSIRAIVPIQNMDEFYVAFDIGPGDAMYLPPEDRIAVW